MLWILQFFSYLQPTPRKNMSLLIDYKIAWTNFAEIFMTSIIPCKSKFRCCWLFSLALRLVCSFDHSIERGACMQQHRNDKAQRSVLLEPSRRTAAGLLSPTDSNTIITTVSNDGTKVIALARTFWLVVCPWIASAIRAIALVEHSKQNNNGIISKDATSGVENCEWPAAYHAHHALKLQGNAMRGGRGANGLPSYDLCIRVRRCFGKAVRD